MAVYPSRAVEANPANTIERADLMGIGSAAMCCRPFAATSAAAETWKDAEAFGRYLLILARLLDTLCAFMGVS